MKRLECLGKDVKWRKPDPAPIEGFFYPISTIRGIVYYNFWRDRDFGEDMNDFLNRCSRAYDTLVKKEITEPEYYAETQHLCDGMFNYNRNCEIFREWLKEQCYLYPDDETEISCMLERMADDYFSRYHSKNKHLVEKWFRRTKNLIQDTEGVNPRLRSKLLSYMETYESKLSKKFRLIDDHHQLCTIKCALSEEDLKYLYHQLIIEEYVDTIGSLEEFQASFGKGPKHNEQGCIYWYKTYDAAKTHPKSALALLTVICERKLPTHKEFEAVFRFRYAGHYYKKGYDKKEYNDIKTMVNYGPDHYDNNFKDLVEGFKRLMPSK